MAIILFPGFELLDVAAPGELLGAFEGVNLVYCAERTGPIKSSCMELAGGSAGPSVVATHALAEGGKIVDMSGSEPLSFVPDAILVPGGAGVRTEVTNAPLLEWLGAAAVRSQVVFTVCTGSWLLATTGALDGIPATSNKNALRNGLPQLARPQVDWVLRARWVEHVVDRGDGLSTVFISSSGVSAGGDAALALIARLDSHERARVISHRAEWSWQSSSSHDPFADGCGL